MRDFKKYDVCKLSSVFTLTMNESTKYFPQEEFYDLVSKS